MTQRLLAYLQNPRGFLLAAGSASAVLLALALIAQYGWALHPCELCMAQRYPYAVIIVLAAIGICCVRAPEKLHLLAIACATLFALDALLAFYHSGVEWGWFPAPSACANTASAGDSLEEMRRQLMDAPLVPCNQPMAHVLGLSLAVWNMIAAGGLAIISFGILRKRKSRADASR